MNESLEVLEEAYLPMVPMRAVKLLRLVGSIRFLITEESLDGDETTLLSEYKASLSDLNIQSIRYAYISRTAGPDDGRSPASHQGIESC